MKANFMALLLCLATITTAFAQEGFNYQIQVKNTKGRPQPNVKVWLKDAETGQTITKRTNSQGQVKFDFPPGKWTINMPGLPGYEEIEVRPGSRGGGSMMLTYDYEKIKKENEIIAKRAKTTFSDVDQAGQRIINPVEGKCVIEVELKDPSGKRVRDIPVELLSVNTAKRYKNVTAVNGMAKFLVPMGENYAVDVDGVRNYTFTGEMPHEGIITLRLGYEPTVVNETNVNDTISQILSDNENGTSARAYLALDVSYQGGPAANEMVYLADLNSKDVYRAKADEKGRVRFLVPKGTQYMMHMDYQPDVDVFNLTRAKGRMSLEKKMFYRPIPELKYPEKYIPGPDELFYTEFQNFMTTNLPEPQGKKVDLYFEWGNDKVNGNSKEAVMQIGIAVTSEKPKLDNVPPLNMAFVLDKSGSMASDDRLVSLKESMNSFIDNLRPEDKMSIITFNDDAALDMPLQERKGGNSVKQFVEEIEAGGGTNIFKGLVMGYNQLLRSGNENAKHLILITDGYGNTPPKQVIDTSKYFNEQGLGLTAIGVGSYYNQSLLSLLTLDQGHLLSHAAKGTDIKAAFEQSLANVLHPVGKDAKLEIKFHRKIEFEKLLGASVETKGQNKVTIQIGDLFRGYNKVALAQFNLHEPSERIEDEPVVLEFSYFDFETNEEKKITKKAQLFWEPATGEVRLFVEREKTKLYAVAIMNQSMKVMAEAFAKGDYQEAINALESTKKQVGELFPHAKDEDIASLLARMTNYVVALENCIKKEQKQGATKETKM